MAEEQSGKRVTSWSVTKRTMATGGHAEKLTAKGKERAIMTKVGKRSDDGWDIRGWKFTEEELSNPPSLRDNM